MYVYTNHRENVLYIRATQRNFISPALLHLRFLPFVLLRLSYPSYAVLIAEAYAREYILHHQSYKSVLNDKQ